MLSPADLDAYLARIGWAGGALSPDRATLEALVLHHTAAIPFENLNPLLGLPVELAPDRLLDKLVRRRRGGYCFEQNGLFWRVLTTIGFEVTGLSARVLWMQAEDAVSPRSHMALLVQLPEGPVLADVGFGGAVLTGLLDMVPGAEQPTAHETFRLLEADGVWRQQLRIGDEWRTTYTFDLQPQLPIDYEAPNWWTATNPGSHFTYGLIAARPLPGRRLALRNADYAVHATGGETARRTLPDAEAVCDVLTDDFGIAIPDRAALVDRLSAILPVPA